MPAVSNKSWLFVPPDLIFGEAPEDARNASGKPDLTYNAKLFAYNLLVPPVWKSIWLSVNVIFVSASPLCWISCATLIDAGVFTASIIPLNVVIPATLTLSKFVWPSTSKSLTILTPAELVSKCLVPEWYNSTESIPPCTPAIQL